MNINNLITEYNKTNDPAETTISIQKEFITFFKTKNIKNIDIGAFIKYLQSKNNKPATINAKLTHLVTLLKFKNLTPPKFKYLKIQRHKLPTLSRQDVAKMYLYCRHHNKKELLKALRLGLNTGARIDNILKIKPQDIENGYIRFYHNKTNRPYSIPVNSKIKRMLKHFKPFTMNYQATYYQFKLMIKALNLDPKITIHTLRHTFATALINKNVPIPVIQALLNHKNISTTMIYAHIKNKTLENAINLL